YARVFGDPHDAGSPAAALERLVQLLAQMGAEQDGSARALVRIGAAALDLAQQLSERSAGITAWAARDILSHIRAAGGVLQDPDLASALGGSGKPWQLVRMMSPTVLGHPLDVSPHLERARAGLAILSWLGDVAGALDGGRPELTPDAPAVLAAESWLAA